MNDANGERSFPENFHAHMLGGIIKTYTHTHGYAYKTAWRHMDGIGSVRV